jgi:hypothetical protein
MSCDDRDSDGRSLLQSGVWNGDTTLSVQGGQAMHFVISNLNVIGTQIEITASPFNDTRRADVPAQLSVGLDPFARFGAEPMEWDFEISTEADTFLVEWCLFSTWVPGDPNNPDNGNGGAAPAEPGTGRTGSDRRPLV